MKFGGGRDGGLVQDPEHCVGRPERLYCVLVLGLQYSYVLGFHNTGS